MKRPLSLLLPFLFLAALAWSATLPDVIPRHGLQANLPMTTYSSAVLHTTDTKRLYIGNGRNKPLTEITFANRTSLMQIGTAPDGSMLWRGSALTGGGSPLGGDMYKAYYDANNNSKADVAEFAETAPWAGVSGKPSFFTPAAHKAAHAVGGGDALTPADIGAEPAIGAKGTAFNKDFGTAGGTVSQGNHAHGGVYEPVLGNPAGNGYVLSSDTLGIRSWIAQGMPASHASTHITGGTDVIPTAVSGGNAGLMTGADKAKLNDIASGATANQTDAYLLDRSHHTGSQSVSTISGLATVATSGSYPDLTGKPTIPDELADLAADSTHRTVTDAEKSTWDGKLDPTGDGSGLTGITAAQVGAAKDKASADEVYATDYNSGALNSTSINAAITAIGSSVKTLVLTPGNWSMAASITVPENITLKLQPGAVVVQAAGTLTVNGPVDFPRQTCLSGFAAGELTFGAKVKTVYVDWTEAAGDGTTDDKIPLQAIVRSCDNCTVEASGKTYYVATPVYASTRARIKFEGNGARLKHDGVDTPALQVGWPYQTTGSVSIPMTKNSNTFTIPGGVSLVVGEMVKIYASSEYIPGYSYGVLTTVTGISGSTATIDVLPVYDFTGNTIVQYKPAEDVEISGFTFDNLTSSGNSHGLRVYGRNVHLHDIRAYGAETAGIGISVWAINANLERVVADGYLSKLTTSADRYGDGIAVYGNNIVVDTATVTNCKHEITVAERQMISNTITVKNSTLVQDPARFGETFVKNGNTVPLYSGVLDIHGNAENVIIENSQLDGAGIALATIRNGRAVFRANRLRYWNTTATGVGIFMIGETPLQSLVLEGNDIRALTASTPLMVAADGTYDHSIAVASPVYASGIDVNVRQSGTNAFNNVTSTAAFPTLASTSLPAVCNNGQIGVDTNAASGQRVYACESGAWVLQGDGVGAGGTTDHSALSNLSYATSGHTGFEPTITTGTTSQYLRGDKSLATLNQAAVAGLTTTSTPTFAGGTVTTADTSTTFTISTTSPSTSRFPKLSLLHYGGSSGGYPRIAMQNSRGTIGTPTATQANDQTATISADGYGDTGVKASGQIVLAAESAFTDANQPTAFTITMGSTGGNGALTERFKIQSTGAISIPAGGSATQSTDRIKLWNVEGDYLHILDEDGNDHTIGQGKIVVGDTAQSTVNASKLGGNAASYYATATEPIIAGGTCSTSYNVDMAQARPGAIVTLTLNGTCAIGATNITAGKSFTIDLTQSSTTAPTFTSPYKWQGGTAPTWSTSATKYDSVSCYSPDGTVLRCGAQIDLR